MQDPLAEANLQNLTHGLTLKPRRFRSGEIPPLPASTPVESIQSVSEVSVS